MNREVYGRGMNKQQRTADKVWSSSWKVGRRVNLPYKINNLRNITQSLRLGKFLWNKVRNRRGTYGGEEKYMHNFGRETSRKTTWKTWAHTGK